MKQANGEIKVKIHCLVYNHEPYLRDCLEGFVMQKTDFAFKAVVHDDCSTDNSAAIIREYAEKYPDIIEPIYETENQYRKGTLNKIMYSRILGQCQYVAYCEGDDYWTDPNKLQKQVDYMENHPECSIVCSNAKVLTKGEWMTTDEKKQKKWFHYEHNCILTAEDFLLYSGYTCTLMIKSTVFENYPSVCNKCVWGDYALKIYASLIGSAYCIAEEQAVYRYLSQGSFTSRSANFSSSRASRVECSIIDMLEYLNQFSDYKYKEAFHLKLYEHASQLLKIDLTLAPNLCKQFGHLFLTYPKTQSNKTNKMGYYLRRVKWFPFHIGSFTEVLKKADVYTRIRITIWCIKSYLSHKLAPKTHISNNE